MKAEINLLSPQAKRSRLRRLYLKSSGQILRAVIAGLVITIAAFGVIFGAIKMMNENTTQLNGSDEVVNQDIIKETVQLNNFLQAMQDWSSDSELWVARVGEVLKNMPAAMQLSEIKLVEETGVLQIRGTFTSREALISFQRVLEGLAWVKSVEAPLSNFATGSSATFRFNISAK